jgi:hypothetical protein
VPSCIEQEHLLQVASKNIQLEVRNYIEIDDTEKRTSGQYCLFRKTRRHVSTYLRHLYEIDIKGKGKVHSGTGHEGAEGE